MEVLRCNAGPNHWCLRLAAHNTQMPRVQFAAAVVLHGLGDPAGMALLVDAVKWRLRAMPALANELEAAFIAIGSPDAVRALLEVWNALPDWGDHEPVRNVICRVWAALRDPAVLPTLANSAHLNTARFEDTAAAFGVSAIGSLRELSQSAEPRRRTAAIRTLQRIDSPESFAVLVPLLRDPFPSVRALVPGALAATGSVENTVSEITRALEAGFPSTEALDAVRAEDVGETVISLLERWTPAAGDPTDARIATTAITLMLRRRTDSRRAAAVLCALLRHPQESEVAIHAMTAIETFVHLLGGPSQEVTDCLAQQACSSSAQVRRKAAQVLWRFGDSFPLRVLEFLDASKPPDTLIAQLQLILRGGREAGLAANQAFQSVSRWWAGLTEETATGPVTPSDAGIETDPRTAPMLRGMLSRSLQEPPAPTIQGLEERAAFMVLVLHAIARLGPAAARQAWPELVATLHLPGAALSGSRSAEDRCYGLVTLTAAETIIELYGEQSFGLFLDALFSTRVEVTRTAIRSLEALADARAVAPLRTFASAQGHPCAELAARAIERIRRSNPEMMSLLRGSSGGSPDPATLLRAARSSQSAQAPESLLRATSEQPDSLEASARN